MYNVIFRHEICDFFVEFYTIYTCDKVSPVMNHDGIEFSKWLQMMEKYGVNNEDDDDDGGKKCAPNVFHT